MVAEFQRLPDGVSIVNDKGMPSLAFTVYWQQFCERLENALVALENGISDIQASLALANSNTVLTQTIVAASSAPPISGGSGGGTSASVSSFSSFNSTVHAAVTTELTVTAGSGGTVTLTAADLAVTTNIVLPIRTLPVYGKWQWDNAGVWVDVGTEDLSAPVAEVKNFAEPDRPPVLGVTAGALTSNEVKSGLVAASVHKFRFMARNEGHTRTMYLSGTASAVGS